LGNTLAILERSFGNTLAILERSFDNPQAILERYFGNPQAIPERDILQFTVITGNRQSQVFIRILLDNPHAIICMFLLQQSK
jgi:hypothetical protein